MREWIERLFFENGRPSWLRILPPLAWGVFFFVSIYLAVNGIYWQNYDSFATASVGGGAMQVFNKFINSKYNSELGSFKEKEK